MNNFSQKLSSIGEALEVLVKGSNLDLRDVWLNIDSSVPRTPAVLIEPQGMTRNMQETGFTTINEFTVHFTVLHNKLGSESVSNQTCLGLAEDLEDVLHSDRTLDKKLVHSYVQNIEMGLATRQNVTLRAARLVWQGWNKTRLGPT